jgi:hypothetical protein
MIKLIQGLTNSVVMTLNERTTINSPLYLFQFINDQTKKQIIFTSNDLSNNKQRYNLFEIVPVSSTSSENLLNGEVYMSNYGFYSYNIYETATYSLPLNINGLDLVEQGRVTYIPNGTQSVNQLSPKNTLKNI